MFYIELTSDQKESALTQCNVIRPKPALPPKPKMGAGNENKKPAPLENAELEIKTKSEPHHDLTITRNDESIQNENGLPANTYPCICEHLNIEVTVPTPSECRKYFLKRSLEDANLLMRYLDTGRDSGNSSVASSSSSSLIYVPSSNSRNTATASVTTPTQTTTASATNQQQQSSVVCSEIPMQNTPVEGSNVRKPLVGETRVNTLERNRIQAIEDEHKYETLDHGARPPQLSEDEGVCCTNIKSKITKKAKELVRPYQKGDHPRDRPPIPAKPPRPSLQKSSRPNSNEGISDRESNYNESLDLVGQIQAAVQTAGYEPIDTSRSIVPPIPGVPTKGRLTKKDSQTRQSLVIEDMEQGNEFKPTLASQTSIELVGTAKKRMESESDVTPELQIDVKVIKQNEQKGYKNVKAVKDNEVAEPSKPDEKKSLIKRVKSIKMENPFKKAEAEEDIGESSDKSQSGLKKMFKKKDKENVDEPNKPSFSEKIGKVFQREKKEGVDDNSEPPMEGDKGESRGIFGKIFNNEQKRAEQADEFTNVEDADAKKPSLMSKILFKDSKKDTDQDLDEPKKKSFMVKMFQKNPKDTVDDEYDIEEDDNGGKKTSLIGRVFSRDGQEDNQTDAADKKTFSEKISEMKEKVFSKKEKDVEAEDESKDPSEKKTLLEKYFPSEKPMIQQFVLTEEMEPDLKKRRMGKITSFQQTREVEGEVESPAKKMIKENLNKIATKVKEVQEFMPKTFVSTKERDPELDKPDYEITTQVTVRRTPSPCRFEGRTKTVSESSTALSDRDDLHITPVPAEGNEPLPTDKSTVFYAKVGDSQIEVKEDHYGRIQMGDKKEPIYAKPFKLLKKSLNDLSKSTPSLSTRSEEPIEYIDVTELSREPKEESLSHHYEQLGEPGKRRKLVSKMRIRGGHGSPKMIMVETELVKGKSLSSLNEPATMSVVKTVEKQKPPVPPRPRTITPTIIGKPPSTPTTPTSSINESCSLAPFALNPGCNLEEGVSQSSTRATTPSSVISEFSRKKAAPPRPPPPTISMVTTKVTPSGTKTIIKTSESKPIPAPKRPSKPSRPPPPKVTVTKTVQKTAVSGDKYSVYCQTDVGLSTDLLAKIERVVSSSYDESPYKPPRSRSTSKSVDNVGIAGGSSCSPKPYDAVFYDEPVRLRKTAHSQETELSKRISTLQSFRRSLVEQGGTPLQAAVALAIVLFWIYCPFFLLSFRSLCCLAVLFLVFFK